MPKDYSTIARQAAKDLLSALGLLHRELVEAGLSEAAALVADYAWGGYMDDHVLDAMHELSSAVELCGANLMLPDGTNLYPEANKALLQQLLNAANARMALDEGDSVRVEELAALARVAEKTVRMATNPARSGSIHVRKEGHWAFIDAPEALAWLRRRDDYQPTRKRGNKGDQLLIADAAGLASACLQWRKHKAVSIEALAKALHWTASQRNAYQQIEASELTDQMTCFAPKTMRVLGMFLGMPQPEDFARQAFRVLAAQYAEYASDHQLAGSAH